MNRNVYRTLVSVLIVTLLMLRIAKAERWSDKTTAVVEFGTAVLTVALIWVYWAGKENSDKNGTNQPPELTQKERKATSANMKLAAVGLLIVGCFSLRALFGAFDFVGAIRSEQAWPSVTGRIQTVRIESSTSKNGDTCWFPVWSYSYSVNGKPYHSGSRDLNGRVALSNIRSVNDANAIATARPIGAEVAVYYDPSAPQHSVLDRRTLTALDWLGFLVVGAVPAVMFGGSGFLLYRSRPRTWTAGQQVSGV